MRPGYAVVEVPNPPPGRTYMMLSLPSPLVEHVGRLIANGTAETELERRIEETVREFLASQPIDLHLARP